MHSPVPTGVAGLDEILGGGLRAGACVLIEGVPGSGKTTLGLQIIVAQARAGRTVAVVSFEQLPGQLKMDALGFGWDLEELEEQGLLHLFCTSPDVLVEEFSGAGGPISQLLSERRVEFILIDSISHLREYMASRVGGRPTTYALLGALRRAGVTALLTHELSSADPDVVPYEEYLADVVIRLSYEMEADRRRRRYLEVLKTRGAPHLSGKHALEIRGEGIVVYPRPVLAEAPAAPVIEEQVSTGCVGLDEMLGGGIPRGYSVLIGGSAGVGKTTLAMQVLVAGAKAGEGGLYVAFEESPDKLIEQAESLGLPARDMAGQGLLEVMYVSPLDVRPEELLHRIVCAMDELPARRVALDCLTDLEAAVGDPGRVREFVYALAAEAQRRRVTLLLTAELPEFVGTWSSSREHISILVDGIILLRYLELESEIQRAISVLKLRGSDHDKSIRRFVIGRGGLRVLARFEGAHGVLAGAPRLIPIQLAVRSFTEFDEQLNRELLDRFAQMHPNVEPVPMTLPYNPDEARVMIEQVLRQPSTHMSAVPLCMYWMPDVIDPERLMPVDELCPEPDEHLPDMIEAATVEGTLYAVPALAVCGVLLYREDLLEKHGFSAPPRTWDELVAQAKTIIEAEGREDLIGYEFPGYLYEGLTSTFLQMLWSNGGDVIDEAGRVIVDAPEAVEAARFMRDLVHVHRLVPADITTLQRGLEPQRDFWDGRVIFLTMLPTVAGAMMRRGAPAGGGKVGFAPPPMGPHGTRSVSFLGGWHYSIPRGARAPVTAGEFIRFMSSREIQKERAVRAGLLPSVKDLYDDPEVLAANPHFRVLKEIVFTARSRHYIPHYVRVSRVLQNHLHKMLCEGGDPEAALKAAKVEIEGIVGEGS